MRSKTHIQTTVVPCAFLKSKGRKGRVRNSHLVCPFCFYKNILTAQRLSPWSLMLCWPLCSKDSPGWQCFRNQVSAPIDKGQAQGKARESLALQPLTESRLGLLHVPGYSSRPALSTSSEMTTETALQDSSGPVCLCSLHVACPRIPHHFLHPQTTVYPKSIYNINKTTSVTQI